MKIEVIPQWSRLARRRRWTLAAVSGAALLLLAAVLAIYFATRSTAGERAVDKSTARAMLPSSVRLNLPPPDLLKPITPEEAIKENAERAFSSRPDTAAAAFTLKADEASRERALECMTQAVYYEAASEGADGQRAVAQVVLNRMHHPAYPNTVCGVVYQGAERPFGCQFTFTCDGSLARVPVPSLWKQARRIATEALTGKVFAPAGHATHYHADYVLPYWADSLDKSLQVGRHIFYRLKGGLGASSFFRQRYGGVEPAPPAPTAVEVAAEAVASAAVPAFTPPNIDPNLQAPVGELVASTAPAAQLAADTLAGTLVIDGDAPRHASTGGRRPKSSEDCTVAGGSTRLRPMSVNDVRAQKGAPGC
jgi:spore germination cell wall hydrolase CwlJ-like protein